ncbi:S-layer homology domain-containing protein, partial [Peptoniphilus asaccharolyticus]
KISLEVPKAAQEKVAQLDSVKVAVKDGDKEATVSDNGVKYVAEKESSQVPSDPTQEGNLVKSKVENKVPLGSKVYLVGKDGNVIAHDGNPITSKEEDADPLEGVVDDEGNIVFTIKENIAVNLQTNSPVKVQLVETGKKPSISNGAVQFDSEKAKQVPGEKKELDANKPGERVPVDNPNSLTGVDKDAIKDAIKAANPGLNLTSDNIKFDENNVVIEKDGKEKRIPISELVIKKPQVPGKEETKVNLPSSKVVVGDPNRLTDLEKDLIKKAVKKTNPTIDSNSIKVDDRGNVFIEENGAVRLVLTPSQTIIDGRDNYRPEPRERDRNDNNYHAGSIDFRFVKAPAEKREEKAQVVAPKAEQKVEGRYKAYIFGYKDGSVRPNGKITRAEAAAMVARLMGYSLTDMSQPAFSDTQSAWYNQYINAVVKAGIMAGYPDGTFKPNEYITRAEFAQTLKNLDKANTAVSPFGDVKGHWAEKAIDQAFANQRIKGYEDGTFKPEKNITRAEVVTILNRMQNRTLEEENLPSDVSKFSDLDENAWYYLDMVSATNSYEYAKSKEKADGTHQMVKVIAEK